MREHKILSISKAQSLRVIMAGWVQASWVQNLATKFSVLSVFCSQVSYFCLHLKLQSQMFAHSLIQLWINSYHLGFVVVVVCFGFFGGRAYQWHVKFPRPGVKPVPHIDLSHNSDHMITGSLTH